MTVCDQMKWCGQWSAGQQFKRGHVVRIADAVYVCTHPSLNDEPPDTDHWRPMGGGGMDPDYIAALGKIDPTGYNSLPTFFDPDSTNWDDAGWAQWTFAGGNSDLLLSTGTVSHQVLEQTINASQRKGTFTAYADSDAFSEFFQAQFFATETADGSVGAANLQMLCHLAGQVSLLLTDAHAQIQVIGNAGQTDPLLDLQDSDANSIFSVAPDGSVGGTAPSPGDVLTWDGAKYVPQAP